MEYHLIALLSGQFWPGVVTTDKVLSMGRIEIFVI